MLTIFAGAFATAAILMGIIVIISAAQQTIKDFKSKKAVEQTIKSSGRQLSEIIEQPDGLLNLIKEAVPKDLGLVYETEITKRSRVKGEAEDIGITLAAKDINGQEVSRFFMGETYTKNAFGTEARLKKQIQDVIRRDYTNYLKEQSIGQKDIIF